MNSDDELRKAAEQEIRRHQYMLAKMGYEAYGSYTNFKTYDDKPMPKWDDLPLRIKNAWVAVWSIYEDYYNDEG